MSLLTINLSDYCYNGNYDLVTGTQGVVVRTASKIDLHVREVGNTVRIEIPKEVFILGQPFLEELLENAILYWGREDFNQNVEFISLGRYNVKLDLEEVMKRVLDEQPA